MNSIVDFLQSTMLIERLFGVGTYVLALGYFYNQIRCSKDFRKIEKYLNHYLIVLCTLAFFYVPGPSADLSRWRAMAEPWEKADLMWFLENRVLVSTVPAGYLLVFLCQKTGINGILPMICAAGFFGNVFHMIKFESKRENVNSDSVAVTLLFVMSTGVFLEVISGVRCMLALSIVIRCAYDEMRLKELRRYKAYYCGVCRALGSFTLCGRCTLSFEAAFFALLGDCGAQSPQQSFFCAAKMRRGHYVNSAAVKRAAYLNILLAYYKLSDDIADGQAYKLPLIGAIAHAYRCACNNLPQENRICRGMLAALRRLERDKCPCLDRCADVFAGAMGSLCAMQSGDNARYAIGYALGRWVYITDAADDIKSVASPENVLETAERSLYASLKDAENAALRLPEEENKPVILNIITQGLPRITREVFLRARGGAEA